MTERRTDQTAPMRFPLPPVLLAGALGLGVLTQALVPLPWLPSPLSDILAMVGAIVILGGLWLIGATIAIFRKARTTVRPDKTASHLVTAGPFRLSRNPIYLGMVMALTGLGALTGNLWLILVAIAFAVLIGKLAIAPEERHLEVLFGKRYRDYARRVRRWF